MTIGARGLEAKRAVLHNTIAMSIEHIQLTVLDGAYAVCRLGPRAEIPRWARSGAFLSITRTADELSIVCAQDTVPADVASERDWRALVVDGPLDFALVGVLASLVAPLADAGVAVLTVSTYDTDYLFVKGRDLHRAIDVLNREGFPCR